VAVAASFRRLVTARRVHKTWTVTVAEEVGRVVIVVAVVGVGICLVRVVEGGLGAGDRPCRL
jgi:hypothetical protein